MSGATPSSGLPFGGSMHTSSSLSKVRRQPRAASQNDANLLQLRAVHAQALNANIHRADSGPRTPGLSTGNHWATAGAHSSGNLV